MIASQFKRRRISPAQVLAQTVMAKTMATEPRTYRRKRREITSNSPYWVEVALLGWGSVENKEHIGTLVPMGTTTAENLTLFMCFSVSELGREPKAGSQITLTPCLAQVLEAHCRLAQVASAAE